MKVNLMGDDIMFIINNLREAGEQVLLSFKQSQLEAKNKEINELSTKHNQLSEELKSKQSLLEIIKSQLEDYNAEKRQHAKYTEKLEEQQSILKNTTNLTMELQELQKSLRSLQQKQDIITKQREIINKTVDKRNQIKSDINNSLQMLEKLTGEKIKLVEEISNQKNELLKINQEIGQYENYVSYAQEKYKNNFEIHNNAVTRLSSYDLTQKNNKSNEYETLKEQVAATKNSLKLVLKLAAEPFNAKDALEKQLIQDQNRLEIVYLKMKEIQNNENMKNDTQYENDIEFAEAEINKILKSDTNKTLQALVEETQSSIKDKSIAIDKEEKALEELNQEIKNTPENIINFQVDASLEEQIEEAKSEIESIRNKLSDMEQGFNLLSNEKAELSIEIKQLEEKISKQKEQEQQRLQQEQKEKELQLKEQQELKQKQEQEQKEKERQLKEKQECMDQHKYKSKMQKELLQKNQEKIATNDLVENNNDKIVSKDESVKTDNNNKIFSNVEVIRKKSKKSKKSKKKPTHKNRIKTNNLDEILKEYNNKVSSNQSEQKNKTDKVVPQKEQLEINVKQITESRNNNSADSNNFADEILKKDELSNLFNQGENEPSLDPKVAINNGNPENANNLIKSPVEMMVDSKLSDTLRHLNKFEEKSEKQEKIKRTNNDLNNKKTADKKKSNINNVQKIQMPGAGNKEGNELNTGKTILPAEKPNAHASAIMDIINSNNNLFDNTTWFDNNVKIFKSEPTTDSQVNIQLLAQKVNYLYDILQEVEASKSAGKLTPAMKAYMKMSAQEIMEMKPDKFLIEDLKPEFNGNDEVSAACQELHEHASSYKSEHEHIANTARQAAMVIAKLNKNGAPADKCKNITKDPRYKAIKNHRGKGKFFENLARGWTKILNALTGNKLKLNHRDSLFYRRTESEKHLDKAVENNSNQNNSIN